MSLLSAADLEKIQAKIAEIEGKSAGEIVVAIVPRSGDYALGKAAASFAFAVAAALAFIEYRPDLSPLWALALEIAVAVAVYFLLGITRLERLLIPASVADQHVKERAFALFAEHGVHRTRGNTGVLVFLSELEHEVVILGDRTIHERLGQKGWQEHIDRIVAAVRRGEAGAGILEVLELLGKELIELVPVEPGDRDELSNAVIRED